jgi:single-strand DNA-binding protein
LNNVTLCGRIVAEPKTYNLSGDKQMTTFTIATGYDKYTEFTDCVAFEQQAKLVSNHCHKGDMLGIVGRLQTRSYEDKQDGKKRKSTQVVVSSLTLTSSKNTQQEQTSSTSYTQPVEDDNPVIDITSDDLPF